MRITSGYLRSRQIAMPKHIRPTQDKVREALFDMIRFEVQGTRFLDLCAGSGAVGIEALSNGAKEVTFVESDKRCVAVIEENLAALAITDSVTICKLDAVKSVEFFHRQKKTFDIIFLDPPYHQDLAKKILQMISGYAIVPAHGIVIVEHSTKDVLDSSVGDLTCFKQKRYADKRLSLYHRA